MLTQTLGSFAVAVRHYNWAARGDADSESTFEIASAND